MHRTRFSWVALVGIGLAGMLSMTAAAGLATSSAAGPFEIVAVDRFEGECYDWWTCPGAAYVGTFTSGAPFCESGTIDHDTALEQKDEAGRYTCSDGSGSLTLAERARGGEGGEWTVVEGSGRYADLRGKGTHSREVLSEYPPAGVYRTTFQGLAATDAVAPSAAVTSVSASKLRRFPGEYEIRVTLSLRDDVEGNAVAYRLSVTQTRLHRLIELASTAGSTATGPVSKTLRIVPGKRVRTVQLQLSGSDPVGNEVSIARSLKLPR